MGNCHACTRCEVTEAVQETKQGWLRLTPRRPTGLEGSCSVSQALRSCDSWLSLPLTRDFPLPHKDMDRSWIDPFLNTEIASFVANYRAGLHLQEASYGLPTQLLASWGDLLSNKKWNMRFRAVWYYFHYSSVSLIRLPFLQASPREGSTPSEKWKPYKGNTAIMEIIPNCSESHISFFIW